MEQRDELDAVKRRLTRKFRGDRMDDIYPGLGFREQRLAFGRDLVALGRAVIEAEEPANQKAQPSPASAGPGMTDGERWSFDQRE
jgi:hypothetical protein